MFKKFLAKLINSEDPPKKSNWTDAMETRGLSDIDRKKIMDEAKEKLEQEQEQLRQQVKKQENKSKDNND